MILNFTKSVSYILCFIMTIQLLIIFVSVDLHFMSFCDSGSRIDITSSLNSILFFA